MAKLIIVEGPDNSGKSTLISHLKSLGVKELSFPKKTSEGLFKIESRNEVAIFETLLCQLEGTYLVDRGYLSNVIYEGLRGKPTDQYIEDILRLTSKAQLKFIPLTRNNLDQDFEDDLIKLDKAKFNEVIQRYENLYQVLWLTPYKILEHDGLNNVVKAKSIDQVISDLKIKEFIESPVKH